MTRGIGGAAALLVVALLTSTSVPAVAGYSDAGAVGLGLADGGAWMRGTLRLDGAPCVTITLSGAVPEVGLGQAALVDVDGVGRLAVYFAQHEPPAVRAGVSTSGVTVERRVGFEPDASAREYATSAEFCREGSAFSGDFAVRAYHTAGVKGDGSRVEASGGALALTTSAAGRDVRLWNSRDFSAVAAAELMGPATPVAATGQSVLVAATLTVETPRSVFGSFALFELVEGWRLLGPEGAAAWRSPLGGGGNLDAVSFEGGAGSWTAHVEHSVSALTPGQAFLVLAVEG